MYDTDSGSTICASCATNMTEGQIVDSVEIIDGYNEICDCCQCVIVPLYPDNDDEYYNIPIDYKEVT